jgi:DNA replication licensing factor MCM2
MEQQTISISKAGIVTTLQACCAVLAVANPTEGRYDPTRSFAQNVNLSDPILSRFDVLCVLRDESDPTKDEMLADHVVCSHMRSHPEADAGDKRTQPRKQQRDLAGADPIDQDLLQKYIVYARKHVKPEVTDIDKDKLARFYQEIRQEAFRSGGAPMTARHIDSIMRLTQASAKMELRQHCTSADLDWALSVTLESFIQSQKHQVAEELRKRFRQYIAHATPISDQIMALLDGLIKDRHEQVNLSRAQGEPEIELSDVAVEMADVVRQIESDDLDIDQVHEFMASRRFRQNFRVEGESIFRV